MQIHSVAHRRRTRFLQWIIAAVSAFAIILQLLLMIETNRKAGIPAGFTAGNYFSFFTVLSNTLVLLSVTLPLVAAASTAGKFFRNSKVISAITVYIFIVGLVYNVVLRKIWHPTGWNIVTDEILHVADPLLYIFYWVLVVNKKTLGWKDMLPWLLFPAAYLLYTLIRGAFTGWYPYPFLHAGELGYARTLLNASFILAAILATSSLLIVFNRRN